MKLSSVFWRISLHNVLSNLPFHQQWCSSHFNFHFNSNSRWHPPWLIVNFQQQNWKNIFLWPPEILFISKFRFLHWNSSFSQSSQTEKKYELSRLWQLTLKLESTIMNKMGNEEKIRNLVVVVIVNFVFLSCENPKDEMTPSLIEQDSFQFFYPSTSMSYSRVCVPMCDFFRYDYIIIMIALCCVLCLSTPQNIPARKLKGVT